VTAASRVAVDAGVGTEGTAPLEGVAPQLVANAITANDRNKTTKRYLGRILICSLSSFQPKPS